ncbi:hypothetical protein HanPI659440_Chr17g0678781 [Helianthus annuus]|uniref:Uncharacterized protein n=1 Tax=Helianthus annuus TaxID=4232 RepID=A0A9K3H772_HELAN|nr:hypothetical protein HanXRQr2_Chr14g0637911 [Helianthus annuus]KAJ0667527.1 hypothetical protein HanPI659440_Chr17g0678781 [Helianthus annuus]KAJ0839864.1 hypothetical protein HanPSC8_Chr14g0611851 [Helianthus annuus]
MGRSLTFHLNNGHIELDSKEKHKARTLVVRHFGSQGPLKVNLRLGTRLHGNGERRNVGQWSNHRTLLVC